MICLTIDAASERGAMPGTLSNGVEGNEGFLIDWASGVVSERPSGLRTFELAFYVKRQSAR